MLWRLSVFPTAGTHFELSPDEFRDSLAMRYGKTPTRLQSTCDADGEVFDVNHAVLAVVWYMGDIMK